MQKPPVWQAAPLAMALVLAFLALPVSCRGAEIAFTSEQRGLLDEFLTFRPAAGGGVWMLAVWDSDTGLDHLVGLPSGEDNAAASFRRLEELYPAEKSALETDGSATRGVQLLLEAADMAECRLSPEYYPEFDRMIAKQPDFLVLRSYLKGLFDRAAKAERNGDLRDAERCYRASLVCGWHLTGDRSSTLVYMTGLIFKLRGAREYENFLRRSSRADQADAVGRYVADLGTLLRAFYWKANQALGKMENFASLPVAIKVAAEDREACWRKDALFRLGIFRLGAAGKGAGVIVRNLEFERAAEQALARAAANDPDPSVRRFAVWVVLNVKPEDYESLEHRF